jgi:hypothetical protein
MVLHAKEQQQQQQNRSTWVDDESWGESTRDKALNMVSLVGEHQEELIKVIIKYQDVCYNDHTIGLETSNSISASICLIQYR